MRHVLALIAVLCASPALAERYSLSLGNDAIGTLDVTAGRIASSVTGSPLGVGNGRFEATSRQVQMADGSVVTQYLSNSPEKGRTISVLHNGGRVIDTTVSPETEATALSDPAAVPAGVSDPVAVLGSLLRDRNACPRTMRFYEGRRVVTLSPAGSDTDGNTLTCEIAYSVTGGPGHFSPLFINNATMEIAYDGGRMTRLSVRTGPFTLNVTPR